MKRITWAVVAGDDGASVRPARLRSGRRRRTVVTGTGTTTTLRPEGGSTGAGTPPLGWWYSTDGNTKTTNLSIQR
jgi:hypothetical protein